MKLISKRKFRASGNNKDKTRFVRLKQEMQRVTRQAFHDYVMDILDPATDINAKRLYSYVTKSQKRDSNTVGPLRAPMARRRGSTHPQVGRRTPSTTNSPPSSLLWTKMICRGWSPHHTKRCLGLISTSIGLYRDVWIAAIASSRTRLATLSGVMCST